MSLFQLIRWVVWDTLCCSVSCYTLMICQLGCVMVRWLDCGKFFLSLSDCFDRETLVQLIDMLLADLGKK